MHGSKSMWQVKKKKNFIGKNFNVSDFYDSSGLELGRGNFGIVHLYVEKKMGKEFACKSMSKSNPCFDMEDVKNEVAIMDHLPPHPNIVAFKEAFDDEDDIHLIMELCKGGKLTNSIFDMSRPYSESWAASIIRTIMKVVQMCHKHGVMHRDLKPDNFVFANRDENSPLKLIDFGLATFFKQEERFSEFVGTGYFMAPEVYNGDYGPEVDIWSAGVILHLLMSGQYPFTAPTKSKIKKEVLYANVDFAIRAWKIVSYNAKSLVRHMLDRNPKTRYTAKQVLSHRWLQKYI